MTNVKGKKRLIITEKQMKKKLRKMKINKKKKKKLKIVEIMIMKR
jgi:hypothetical protein